MTEKRTKLRRLIAISDAYRKLVRKTEWTTGEVVDWAMENELFPVPGMRQAIEHHARWNKRFSEVTGNLEW